MQPNKIVSRDEWLEARRAHLANEKKLTRLHDQLMVERRALPWVKVDKSYVFDTPSGEQTLRDLFDGRSQLIVKHFMLGPDWAEGCTGCSFGADHLDGALLHVEHHDVSFVAVSRAPLEKIEAFRKRMGWKFRWASSCRSDFNYDFNVSFTPEDKAKGKAFYNFELQDYMSDEMPGSSVFYKDPSGDVFHTYSTYARGNEGGLGAYNLLDMTPKGRNENGPYHNLMDWVRLHDRYDRWPDGSSHHRKEDGDCCH